MKRLILSLSCAMAMSSLWAEISDSLYIGSQLSDELSSAVKTDSILADSAQNKVSFINKVINYFTDANKEHPDKAFDISFIGGPHYSKEAGFGIGLIGSGRYRSGRNWRNDTITPYSNVSLKLDVATGQYYEISADGYHILPGDKFRLNYEGKFYSFADKFWGIGYENNINDANESNYNRFQLNLQADFVFSITKSVFIGPMAKFDYVNAHDIENISLFEGQDSRITSFGVGATFIVDTRDYPTCAYSGVYLRLNQLFNPKFLGNNYHFSMTELKFAYFHKLWKGGVLASMVHACMTYGDTPWDLLPTFGGSRNMRGYYEGRFTDKDEFDVCVELRQHVWRRNGIVLWVGAGSVFPRLSDLRMKYILPNAGIGYRWEFKKRVNVRLDLGVGKHQKGINFSINEAF